MQRSPELDAQCPGRAPIALPVCFHPSIVRPASEPGLRERRQGVDTGADPSR